MKHQGWVRNDEAIAETTQYFASSGGRLVFGDAHPELKGYWKRLTARGVTGVFLYQAEKRLFGRYRDAFPQHAGTCVGRGFNRATQDRLYYQITNCGDLLKPVEFSYEALYAGSRVQIGRGQLGWSDGSNGGWAARYLHDYGALPRGQYGNIDLTKNREDWAVAWGGPRAGTPAPLVEASKQYTVSALHRVTDVESLADAIAAGYPSGFCCGWLWGQMDSAGMARPEESGGHCEEICGVFLTPTGELAFIKQGSWGNNYFGPATHVETAGGPVELRPGSFGVYGDDIADVFRQSGGDNWHIGGVKAPRPSSTQELAA